MLLLSLGTICENFYRPGLCSHASRGHDKAKSCNHKNCSIKAFRILGVKLHNFQNTFHQLFWRYGNPDMHFLGTLKIEFLILDV